VTSSAQTDAKTENAKPAEAAIEFRNVSASREGRLVLRDLNFGVSAGETLVLLGRSGSGKTTALRLINRLLEPSSGEIFIEGRLSLEWEPTLLRRRMGYVIQEAGLFPHFTVEQNIGLAPKLAEWPEEKIRARVLELLALVGLDAQEFAGRYPHQLSGGQRQRVGVARALGIDPAILLMDEPFGALDPVTRADLQKEFLALRERLQKTIVFVTHDVREALLVGHRIAVLNAGQIEGIYKPGEFLRAREPEAAAYVAALREQDRMIQERSAE
jgi:osmoprotectant transport system ATP-binding protein